MAQREEIVRIPIYIIDAFSIGPFTGNPAAVCPLEAWLPDEVLQNLAFQNNLSETAFYVQDRRGEVTLRWFTPMREVDLCGHATLAAARVLFDFGGWKQDRVIFETKSGPLRVFRDGKDFSMDFPAFVAVPCPAPAALRRAFGLEIQSCFCGMDYLVVLNNEEQVAALKPDLSPLCDIELRGVIVTARGRKSDFVSRYFAPKYGIDEDPATGSAHCILAPYWAGILGRSTLTGRQLSPRGGLLRCRMAGERVILSGRTNLYLTGMIDLAEYRFEAEQSLQTLGVGIPTGWSR
ncbi:MAG: PhzF family phenazine biosynthesis protein [Verrucomicrobiia bacterium]